MRRRRLSGAAPLAYLQQQLHDVPVNQTQHGLAVHVRDEIARSQPRFLRRAPLFHALQSKHRDFYLDASPSFLLGFSHREMCPAPPVPPHVERRPPTQTIWCTV